MENVPGEARSTLGTVVKLSPSIGFAGPSRPGFGLCVVWMCAINFPPQADEHWWQTYFRPPGPPTPSTPTLRPYAPEDRILLLMRVGPQTVPTARFYQVIDKYDLR